MPAISATGKDVGNKPGDKSVKSSSLREVLASLEKSYPGAPAEELDFFVVVILGAITPENFAAFRRLRDGFSDWNEVRVARMVELAKLLEPLPEPDALAFRLRAALNKLFELRGAMDLAFLLDMRISEARRRICGLDKQFTRQTADYILSAIVPTVAPPLSDAAIQAARRYGLLPARENVRWFQHRMREDLKPVEAARLAFLLTLAETARQRPAPVSPARPRRKRPAGKAKSRKRT